MNQPLSPTTRKDYEQRMLHVLVHIQKHLDDALCLDDIAAVAHFSPYHFHRIFRGMVGESVQAHVRRLRLERAAQRLKNTDQRVTQIAFDAGYETHEAFTRAFRSMFDTSPTEFRQLRREIAHTDIPSGVHYSSDATVQHLQHVRSSNQPLTVRIENTKAMNVAFIRHTGPYDQVGHTWSRLFAWAGPRGLVGMMPIAFGMIHDDPDITPPDRLRCDTCLVIQKEIAPDGDIGIQTIESASYAITRHTGPYERFSEIYARLCGEWLPESGHVLRPAPALEFYRNSPLNTKPEHLITDIYLPLEDQR